MGAFSNIVLYIPHSSPFLPCNSGWGNLLGVEREIRTWTDWHTSLLFNPNKDFGFSVKAFSFPYSRFYIDAERLVGDPLEDVGQGIIYERFNGLNREVGRYERTELMRRYQAFITEVSSAIGQGTLVVDCHSFPSRLSDVDVCIGHNFDESRPDDDDVEYIRNLFSNRGYKTEVNNPYTNSITPKGRIDYKSVMIEVNKRCYMNEETLELKPDYYKLGNLIQMMYGHFLGLD